MNKLLVSILLASGFMLLETSEAVAHEQTDTVYRSHTYYRSDAYRRDDHRHGAYSRDGYRRDHHSKQYRRASGMPRWLEHNRSFRHWFEHTRLREDRYLSWHELFDIYVWEHSRHHYRR